jgi:uncharacterized protein YbjT (DUF2867 family)
MSDKTILVIGITGQQGGAMARQLLAKSAEGWRVRGLVRDLDKPAAKAFQTQGVELVVGDLDDRASLDRAVRGAYGVYSVQTVVGLPEVEIRQGNDLADAAKAAGVQHFVYASVGGADRNTGNPHFDSKWVIEEHIRAIGLPATILRPVFFMDNFNWLRPVILSGIVAPMALRPQTRLQLIAVDDIAGMAALAFAQPQQFIGKALEIAGDELTFPQIAEVFTRVVGRPIRYAPELAQRWGEGDDGAKLNRWFDEKGFKADIPALRAIYPALMDFETFLRKTGWENAEPMPLPDTNTTSN